MLRFRATVRTRERTPRAEDDGYVLEVVYNAFDHKSELQVFRADALTDQVCCLKLSHHLPHQFHGYFSSEVHVK